MTSRVILWPHWAPPIFRVDEVKHLDVSSCESDDGIDVSPAQVMGEPNRDRKGACLAYEFEEELGQHLFSSAIVLLE